MEGECKIAVKLNGPDLIELDFYVNAIKANKMCKKDPCFVYLHPRLKDEEDRWGSLEDDPLPKGFLAKGR